MRWIVLLPAVAAAGPAPVIGGSNAPAGAWPDVAAVYMLDNGTVQQECTGTLVAPTVVLTAGHCQDPTAPIQSVLIGTASLDRPGDGEMIDAAQVTVYPSYTTSEDVTVIVLAHASRFAPRAIATGWARADIQDGAAVELVGYGAIDRNAMTYVPDLQQAATTITDAGCTQEPGCNTGARPDGELGAGGMGIDTCPGDSGGPMYLVTPYGTFLAGVTSRSYDNAVYACSEGGIYTRPDKVIGWIEATAGVPVAHGPEPTFDPVMAVRGDAAETTIVPNDPKSSDHTFAITTPPAHGAAQVRDDGTLRVCTDPAMAGSDALVVTVIDAHDGARKVDVTVPIAILDGTPGAHCDPSLDGGGCCDSGGGGGGAAGLSIAVLAVLRRRR